MNAVAVHQAYAAALTDRANIVYLRGLSEEQRWAFLPFSRATQVEHHSGYLYVVLRRDHLVLAVYRVLNDGRLKRLIRWPRTVV